MEVEYREIPGFPGYRVGDDGSVWSCRVKGRRWFSENWKNLKFQVTKQFPGYLQITLKNKNKKKTLKISRLVLEAFVGPCPDGMEAAHNDNNSKNNELSNLRWATSKSNNGDKIKHGTYVHGESCLTAKLTEDQVKDIRKEYAKGAISHAKLGKKYGVSYQTVCSLLHRETWKHVV